jgi:hypothetical protein
MPRPFAERILQEPRHHVLQKRDEFAKAIFGLRLAQVARSKTSTSRQINLDNIGRISVEKKVSPSGTSRTSIRFGNKIIIPKKTASLTDNELRLLMIEIKNLIR